MAWISCVLNDLQQNHSNRHRRFKPPQLEVLWDSSDPACVLICFRAGDSIPATAGSVSSHPSLPTLARVYSLPARGGRVGSVGISVPSAVHPRLCGERVQPGRLVEPGGRFIPADAGLWLLPAPVGLSSSAMRP